MAESILPSRSRRMRGLLFPYRFSSVVNSFFCMCMGKGKEGGNRAKGETEKGWRAKVKTLVGIESLHTERIGERNGRTECRTLIGAWFWDGIFCVNIFTAVPSLISFKELKASFKIVCRDPKCHPVSSPGCIPLPSVLLSIGFGLVLEGNATLDLSAACWPTCQRAGHLFQQVACSVPGVCSVYPHSK